MRCNAAPWTRFRTAATGLQTELRGQKNMGVASRVADYAQKPALHEGRGMVAGRVVNVRCRQSVPLRICGGRVVKGGRAVAMLPCQAGPFGSAHDIATADADEPSRTMDE